MTDLKQLKCPACGSSEVEQQSDKLVKCSHCGSSLILKNNLLTSVNENTIKATYKSKQPMLIIVGVSLIAIILLFINLHNDAVLPISSDTIIETTTNPKIIAPIDPVELEKRKLENEATFIPNVEISHQIQGQTVVGGIYWIVQLKNISSKPVSRSRVVVSVFDENDKRIEEQSGWSIKEVLQPNESSTVLVLIAKPPAQMARYELTASASKMSFLLKNQVDMQVIDFVINQENERYEIIGDVKNPNSFAVNYTKVIAEALDQSSNPVGLAYQFSTQKHLKPGESSGFKISSTTFVAKQPSSWRLWALARKEKE
jgi:DNA-directed RNA polymerase subunit RPC12/RpoP